MSSDRDHPDRNGVIAEHPIRVLSISCVFPRPDEPELGLFVRQRLQHLAEGATVRVVCPVPFLDLAHPKGNRVQRKIAGCREVLPNLMAFYPRWFYPPRLGGFNGAFLALRMLPFVRRLRREFRFELIDAHFGHPEGVAAGLLSWATGVPYMVTLRGNESMHGGYWLRRLWMSWSLRRAGRVITVSRRLQELAISFGASPDRTVVIPNGVDDQIYFPRDQVECRVRHSIPLGVPVVLSAGYLIERKGHHRVIHALSRLAKEGRTVQLLIAGGPGREGTFQETIRDLVDQLGLNSQVRFLGWVPPEELAELMSAADLLCLASDREGWPNVVHEAMSCGTPVVATDVGAVPEMIPSEEYGIHVPLDNPEALADALRAGLEQHWDRDRIAGWARSRSWTRVAQEVLQQVRELVGSGPASKTR